jgi:hypothetical protein
MSNESIDKIIDKIANQAESMGLDLNQLIDCLNKSVTVSSDTGAGQKEGPGVPNYGDDETKGEEPVHVNVEQVILDQQTASQAVQPLLDLDALYGTPTTTTTTTDNTTRNTNAYVDDAGFFSFGKTAFGKKVISKSTESVRQIAKKKGIYIVGRKGKKFLGIRFTKKGNYSKNKKGRPNGKMYTYDGLKKMTNKRVSFKKLPELIDMMNTKAVLKKYKNFKFGFELKKQRSCGFGYTFPVGAGYGRRSALLYGKL